MIRRGTYFVVECDGCARAMRHDGGCSHFRNVRDHAALDIDDAWLIEPAKALCPTCRKDTP